MPGFDGTGPRGLGPRTGWGRGPCMAGRGIARGRGRRFFRRAWNPYDYAYEDYEPVQEELIEDRKTIQDQMKTLESELKRIKEKLKNLEIEE